jgi:hypothetical protein
MATERIIDLACQRYADREYTGILPPPSGLVDDYLRVRRAEALTRLRACAVTDPVVADLLTALGLNE